MIRRADIQNKSSVSKATEAIVSANDVIEPDERHRERSKEIAREDPRMVRGLLSKLTKYVGSGVEITPEQRAKWYNTICAIIEDPEVDPDTKMNAMRLGAKFDELNIKRYEVLDKISRLDAGQPTENVTIKMRFASQDKDEDAR